MDIFIEISLIIALTILISGVLNFLKQPLIIGYIVAGIIAGPSVFNFITSSETLGIFSHIGIAFLLFTIGLSLDTKSIQKVGKVSLITGLGQVIFTSFIGFFIALALGFETISAVYISVALTFSSTIIIMKLLSDKGDAQCLYGRISIGFLLVQDLIVILVLMGVSSLIDGFSIHKLAFDIFVKGAGLIVSIFLFGKYILTRIIKIIAQSQEFLLLFSIGWCLALSSLSYFLGFSIEIGALFAGLTLAMSQYRHEIAVKMTPIRDFFIVLFFVLLGSKMVFADITQYIVPIILFSLFIFIGNPLIVIFLMGRLGYSSRNGFLAGLTVAQISEFSLILVALGVTMGHLESQILSIVTVIGIITITGSTYLILYAEKIYPYFEKFLRVFEKKDGNFYPNHVNKKKYDTIFFGYNRIGYKILEAFKEVKKTPLVIDYDPAVIEKLSKKGLNCKYGDMNNLELLSEICISDIKMAVSIIPHLSTNLALIKNLKRKNPKIIVIVISPHIDEALELYEAGANYVVLPYFLGGIHLAEIIKKSKGKCRFFQKEKEMHITQLRIKRVF